MQSDRGHIIAELTAALAGKPEIRFAYVFGSFAAGEPFRDIDIAVFLDRQSAVGDHWRYGAELAGQLERTLSLPVDVTIMNDAPDHLTYAISRGEILVNRDEELRTEWIESAWSRYFDFEPIRRQALRDVLG